MRRIVLFNALVVGVTMLAATAFSFEGMSGPTGVLQHSPEKSFQGYTLFSPTMSTTTYLIDMEGNLVHKWDNESLAGLHSVLLPNGNLLRAIQGKDLPVKIGGAGGGIEELDWNGKVVWSYMMLSNDILQHHTFDRMPNGNTLILGWERITNEQMKSKGRTKNFVPTEGVLIRGTITKDFWVDFIREVNPKGETVWEWHLMDHVGKGKDQIDIDYILPESVGTGYSNADWSHFNTCQYVPGKDLIITNSRNLSEVFVIDKKTGKITYRWGNPSTHGAGKAPSYYNDGDQQLFGSHCASMLENGNIIVFDNGSERPQRRRSRIVEIDPATDSIVWEYQSAISSGFYSDRQGAVQKLPNGNYFVTSTNQGHLFEVTPAKEVVWEYVSPVFGYPDPDGKTYISAVVNDNEAVLGKTEMLVNFVHRSYRYGKDYPGLQGKDLSKKLHFTETFPSWRDYVKKAYETTYIQDRK